MMLRMVVCGGLWKGETSTNHRTPASDSGQVWDIIEQRGHHIEDPDLEINMILYVFHMILYGFYLILYGFHMILYGFI